MIDKIETKLTKILQNSQILDVSNVPVKVMYLTSPENHYCNSTIISDLFVCVVKTGFVQVSMFYNLNTAIHIIYKGVNIKNMTVSDVIKLDRNLKLNEILSKI
jgi:hypothetical protein